MPFALAFLQSACPRQVAKSAWQHVITILWPLLGSSHSPTIKEARSFCHGHLLQVMMHGWHLLRVQGSQAVSAPMKPVKMYGQVCVPLSAQLIYSNSDEQYAAHSLMYTRRWQFQQLADLPCCCMVVDICAKDPVVLLP